MELVIKPTDLSGAPQSVVDWVKARIFGEEAEAEAIAPEPEPTVTPEDCHKAALTYIKAKDEDALKAVLDKFGLGKVKECPPEKLADFYAELAIS